MEKWRTHIRIRDFYYYKYSYLRKPVRPRRNFRLIPIDMIREWGKVPHIWKYR